MDRTPKAYAARDNHVDDPVALLVLSVLAQAVKEARGRGRSRYAQLRQRQAVEFLRECAVDLCRLFDVEISDWRELL